MSKRNPQQKILVCNINIKRLIKIITIVLIVYTGVKHISFTFFNDINLIEFEYGNISLIMVISVLLKIIITILFYKLFNNDKDFINLILLLILLSPYLGLTIVAFYAIFSKKNQEISNID